MKTLIALGLLSLSTFASDLEKRPNPFPFAETQAVFGDFRSAHYEIIYDLEKKLVTARAEIELETAEAGHLVFDSHQGPTLVSLDGLETTADIAKAPNNDTTVRILGVSAPAGLHRLLIELPITQLVEFTEVGVKSAFWMSDLTERGYLERYLPTNFLFDRIPTTFHVTFKGFTEIQKIYTNGILEKLSDSEYKIHFPEGLNASCFYFHTMPQNSVVETTFSYTSLDGRKLPSVIYLQNEGDQITRLEMLKQKTIAIMDELERDYGPFPHSSLTVYVAGQGGMEYSGATMTSESALGHELFHSYFARGVMPSNGNAGWIDEALARWRDNGYGTIDSLSGTSSMANHGHYNRVTDRLAYSFGERFIALLDGKVKALGGLKPFLREMVATKTFDPLSTEDFISYMNAFFGMSFELDFKNYVMREVVKTKSLRSIPVRDDHIHRQLSLVELRKLL